MLALGLLIILLISARPFLLWALNVEAAGEELERIVEWSEPRRVDELPQMADTSRVALAKVQTRLLTAIEQRPNHSHAYRLLGGTYLAEREWQEAAKILTQAHQLAPSHPLIAWEAGLAYEQMEQVVAQAPQQTLLSAFATGELQAPPERVETPFCEQDAQSCYMGQTTFIQPLADFAEGTVITAPVLFLHAPAQVKYALTLPAEDPALYFLLGLDPVVRDWGCDGATFQIWVEASQEPATLVYEEAIDAPTAISGWIPGWADLSPWAGKTVTLVLGTGTGAAGNGNADWFGWGELSLTTVEAAQYAAEVPRVRKIEAWRQANLTEEQVRQREEALQ